MNFLKVITEVTEEELYTNTDSVNRFLAKLNNFFDKGSGDIHMLYMGCLSICNRAKTRQDIREARKVVKQTKIFIEKSYDKYKDQWSIMYANDPLKIRKLNKNYYLMLLPQCDKVLDIKEKALK